MKKSLIALGLILLLPVSYTYSDSGEKIPITTNSETAKNYFLQARDMGDKLKAPEASELYNKAIQEDPDFALAYLEKSQFENSGKDFENDINKAVALRDKVSGGEKLLIDAMHENLNGNPTKQVEDLKKVISMFPNDERLHFTLGQVLQTNQNFEIALPELQEAIDINPQFSPAYNMLGYLYKSLGKFDEAENSFQKYISLVPNDPNPYDSYAELLLKEGKFDESIQNYQKALNIDPSFNSSKAGIFAACLYQGKIADARDQVSDFLQNANTNVQKETAHRMLAVSYAYEGQFDQALSELEKEYQIYKTENDYPDMANAQIRIGTVLYENGQYDKANEKFQASLDNFNKSASTQEGKDNFQNRINYQESLVALRQQNTNTLAGAKTESPIVDALDEKTNAQAQISHQLKANEAIEQNEPDVALNELKQANQNDPYVYYLMGRAYQLKGDEQNAKTWFDKTINDNELPTLNSAFAQYNAKKYYNGMK
jgi:tetratricopeptide (TPR) repeat protein